MKKLSGSRLMFSSLEPIAVGAASQRWWLSFSDGRRLEKDGKIPVQRKEGIF